MRWLARSSLVLLALGCAQAPQEPTGDGLVGPLWQLVRFRGGDDRVLTPVDGSQYTLQFQADGRVSARIDCNRGSGTWKSGGKSQIEFGPMAVTRAMCPPGSMPMHDHILKQLPHIRSYVIKNGHLFLSLMADGGTYELEPAR
jgi:para-nitrobenzyl esterase